jgi:hypothetical protein
MAGIYLYGRWAVPAVYVNPGTIEEATTPLAVD